MSVDAGGANSRARSPTQARAASGRWPGPKHKHRSARLQLPIEVYRVCKWCCRQPSPTQPKLQKNKGEVTDELLRLSASPIPRKGTVVETFPYYLRNCSVTSPLVGSPVSIPRLTTHCLRVVGSLVVARGSWFTPPGPLLGLPFETRPAWASPSPSSRQPQPVTRCLSCSGETGRVPPPWTYPSKPGIPLLN